MRGLSDQFKIDLKTGILKAVLDAVKSDYTLCLEIRENFINIYYSGGNILRISEKSIGNYEFTFDVEYIGNRNVKATIVSLDKKISNDKHVESWLDKIAILKNQMDVYFTKLPKEERRYQQLVVHENNFGGPSNHTDYFICDIENAKDDSRFDMVAVHWRSKGSIRKQNQDLGLALIEMKYTDNALTKTSGLVDHIEKLDAFLSKSNDLKNLKDEMKTTFNQKIELGLLKGIKPIASFGDQKPEFILLLSNHDPDSTILRRELDKAMLSPQYSGFCQKVDFKIATSCFMGYGLYDECIYPVDTFLSNYSHVVKRGKTIK